jgi:hypothetical protein
LAGIDDDFFFFWGVGVTSRVFAVLFTAGFATVALSVVWCETKFDECVTLAVGASEGDGDGHESFYNHPLPNLRIKIFSRVSDSRVLAGDLYVNQGLQNWRNHFDFFF